jgi:hypothetical protein
MRPHMILIRDQGGLDHSKMSEDEGRKHFQRFVDWAADLEKRGLLVAVDPLPKDVGRTVRKREGKIVVDGPFAEGHEGVLGYYIVLAPDLDTACRIAAECPHVEEGGTVEVKPILDFPKPPRFTK